MAPLTKETVEVANSAGSTPSQTASPQGKATGGLRADALSLEVAVKVHGSRVLEVARGTAPRTEPFEEQTVTMIVFPQGAVLRMSTLVNVSQMLVLTNLKTKQDSICRVLKVRPNANQGSYVEVEFTHRQPGYWGIQFPSEGPAASVTVAPPQVNLESRTIATPPREAKTAETKPEAVAPTPTFVLPPKPESPFISFGSQEKVQEAASATAITKPLSPVEKRLESHADLLARAIPAEALPAPSSAPSAPPAVSTDKLEEDAGSTSSFSAPFAGDDQEVSSAMSAAHEAPPSLDEAPSSHSQSAASEAFGARLDSSFGSSAAKSSGSNQNWMLIAACVAVLVAGLGAGIAYFRQHPATAGSRTTPATSALPGATTQPSVDGRNELPAVTPPSQPYITGATAANSPNSSVNSKSGTAAPAQPAESAANAPKSAATGASHSSAPAKQPTPGVTSDMMSTELSSRPTTTSRSDEGQSDQAPVLDAAPTAAGTNSLPGISGPNAAALPAPRMQPEGPVKMGGNVKEPKLINSVSPVYPLSARSSGVQGDVIIDTTIDKSGSVVRMHVVSGPAMLRPSALEALKRWKYEPSRLDGEPVEVQMQVTIKFRL